MGSGECAPSSDPFAETLLFWSLGLTVEDLVCMGFYDTVYSTEQPRSKVLGVLLAALANAFLAGSLGLRV